MGNRRRELIKNIRHFRGKCNLKNFHFRLNTTRYEIKTNDNNEFNVVYDFELLLLRDACNAQSIKYLYIFELDTSHVSSYAYMFANCHFLESLELSTFKPLNSNHVNFDQMFYNCESLKEIKTNKTFQDWLIANANYVNLPTVLRDVNYEGWEIIDS